MDGPAALIYEAAEFFAAGRGLQLADGTACGVWHHRFNDGLLDAVQSVLGEVRQEAA